MGHVFIVSGRGQEGHARALAENLQQRGRQVVTGTADSEALTDPRRRGARCTIVVWSGDGETADDDLLAAAEAGLRHNVLIPVRVIGCPPDHIPERYARVRPNVIADPASKAPLESEDPDTIARIIAHLWQLPSVPEKRAATSQIDSHTEPGLAWILLPAALWMVFCLLVTIGIDTALKHYNPYTSVSGLNQHAAYASARRRNLHRLEWLSQEGKRITLARQPATAFIAGQEITVLVHGYNVRSRAIGSYFDDMIAYLRGSDARNFFVVFDWPSGARASEALGLFAFLWALFDSFVIDTVATEAEMYNLGRENARGRSSDAFADLIEFIHTQTGRKVNVVAHSMGCYLLLEALKKHAALSAKIVNLALLAPAVPYDALGQPAITAALAGIGKVFVFHSRQDPVLSVYASFRHASPMLGAVGPKADALLPENIVVRDVTAHLHRTDVHAQYLRTGGLVEIGLVELYK